MKLPRSRLRVFPNPFCVDLTSDGRPCGVCPSDPFDAPGELVGVTIEAAFLTKAEEGAIRGRRQRTAYRYLGVSNEETEPFQLVTELAGKEPVDLANTEYYVARIAEGALIAADIETAALCGVSKEDFEEPADMLERLAQERATHFDVETFENDTIDGDKAYAHFCKKRKASVDARNPAPVTAASNEKPVANVSSGTPAVTSWKEPTKTPASDES